MMKLNYYCVLSVFAMLPTMLMAKEEAFYLEFDRIVSDNVYVSEYKVGVLLTSQHSPLIIKTGIGYRDYDLDFAPSVNYLPAAADELSGGTYNLALEVSGKGILKPYFGFGVEIKEHDFWKGVGDLALEEIGLDKSPAKTNCGYHGEFCPKDEDPLYFNASLGLRVDLIENIYAKVFYQYNYIDDFSSYSRHVNSVGAALGIDF
ncbi:MAG: hypothetical protein ACSHW0_06220 [Thalassotalea sp.]